MIDTNETLLERLRRADAHDAWREFYAAYRGPILSYAHHQGLRDVALDEVLQDTLVALVRLLPQFHYDRARGRFRSFLLRIVHNRARAALKRHRIRDRRQGPVDGNDSIDALLDESAGRWEEEEWRQARTAWRSALAAEALARVRRHRGTKAATMAVFDELVIRGEAAEVVAARHSITVNNVHQIRHRTLERVQRELEALLAAAGEAPP